MQALTMKSAQPAWARGAPVQTPNPDSGGAFPKLGEAPAARYTKATAVQISLLLGKLWFDDVHSRLSNAVYRCSFDKCVVCAA